MNRSVGRPSAVIGKALAALITLLMLVWPLLPVGETGAAGIERCAIEGRATSVPLPSLRVRCADATRSWVAEVVGGADQGRVLERRDGTWLIQPDADGRVALIARFRSSGGDVTAELFDDANGDRAVSYRVSGSELVVTEAAAPTVVVRGRGGWWTRGDFVNFDLDVTVDGLTAALMDPGTHGAVRAQSGERTDGRPDITIEVRDPRGWGQPGSDVRQAYFNAPGSSAVFRTQIMVSEQRSPLEHVTGALLPFVGDQRFGLVQPYGARFPAIQVDWAAAKIAWVGEFVPSRSTGAGWFVYSIRRADAENPTADFENPFAFYDLAGARDGYPDLQIRNHYSLPNTPVGAHAVGAHVSEIRYSWDADHNHTWDFKIDVLGQHRIEARVPLSSFPILSIPYTEYPSWVLGRAWSAATFIAVEDRPYWTSEGIYEWPTGALLGTYLNGGDVTRAAENAYATLPLGMRGEYQAQLDERPYLYVSDVDGRLHLKGARAGLYALPGGRTLRYESLGGEAIDRWVLMADEREETSLTYLADQLILHDSSGVRFKTVTPQRLPDLLLPPSDPDTWSRLAALVSASRLVLAPDDLAGHFQRLPGIGQDSFVASGSAGEFTLDEEGFQFALGMPEAGIEGTPSTGWAAALRPGDYLVQYTPRSGFIAAPLTPGQPKVVAVTVASTRVAALEPVELRAVVTNPGGHAVQGVPVAFRARRVDGTAEAALNAGTSRVDVQRGGTAEARVAWVFPEGGEWLVEATLVEAGLAHGLDGSAGPVVSVRVEPAPVASPWQILLAQGGRGLLGPIVLALLFGTLLMAGAAGALLFGPRHRGVGRRPRR